MFWLKKMEQFLVIQSICGPSEDSHERIDVVVSWLRDLTTVGTVTQERAVDFDSSFLLVRAAVRWLVGVCVEALRVGNVDDGVGAQIDGRVVEVVEVVCGVVRGLSSVGVGGSAEGLLADAAPEADVEPKRSIDSLVSSIFQYLRVLRQALKRPTSSSMEGLANNNELVQSRLDAAFQSAIGAYVASSHLSPGGYVETVLLYPLGALEALLSAMSAVEAASAGGEGGMTNAGGISRLLEEVQSSLVDDSGKYTYGSIGAYEKDLLRDCGDGQLELMSPLEAGLKGYGYEDIADCHRILQQLSVVIEKEKEKEKEGGQREAGGDAHLGRINAVILRLTSRVLQKKHQQRSRQRLKEDQEQGAGGLVNDLEDTNGNAEEDTAGAGVMALDAANFEEGELLVSVTARETDTRRRREIKREVVGLVPKAVGCGIVVKGLRVREGWGGGAGTDGAGVPGEFVRRQCDAFAAVRSVEEIKSDDTRLSKQFMVTMTSMVGAVRCFEAMCTRERRFWGEVGQGLVDVPEVSFAEGDGSFAGVLLEGVESIEQEERVKEILEEKGLPQPSSWVPVGVGVKGVVLCFGNEEDGRRAFEGLGGIVRSDSRKRGAQDTVLAGDAAGPPAAIVDPYSSKRAKIHQRTHSLSRNKQMQGNVTVQVLDHGPPFDVNWSSTLDASQRVDIKYLLNTLFPSKPRMRVGALWPAEERDAAGLRGLDTYLRQKGRAGVVILDKRKLYLVPSTPEGCSSVGVGEFYGSDETSAMLCVLVDD